MTPEKNQRLTNAIGFVSGVIALLDAVRDKQGFWPPAELWAGLKNVQRLEFAAGAVLVVVTIVRTLLRKRPA